MRCSRCTSTNLVTVRLTVGESPVLFASCRSCEHRWWTDMEGDRQLALVEVLDRVAA